MYTRNLHRSTTKSLIPAPSGKLVCSAAGQRLCWWWWLMDVGRSATHLRRTCICKMESQFERVYAGTGVTGAQTGNETKCRAASRAVLLGESSSLVVRFCDYYPGNLMRSGR